MSYNSIENYAINHCFEESVHLTEIAELTENELQYSDMLSGKMAVGLLRLLIKTGGYKNILEVGMFTGYATLGMAEILPEDGKITTIEMNDRYKGIAERVFEKSESSKKIEILFGNAREITKNLSESYDLIFLDADKQFYPTYYETLKPKLKSGGLLVADNVFWSGTVLTQEDRKSKAIAEFNKIVKDDPDMEQVMLTVRDGVLIARKC